ncbi:hypothetical protein KDK77_06780, partial [bacterium]|nr:hypothetical protein [bacterium]
SAKNNNFLALVLSGGQSEKSYLLFTWSIFLRYSIFPAINSKGARGIVPCKSTADRICRTEP